MISRFILAGLAVGLSLLINVSGVSAAEDAHQFRIKYRCSTTDPQTTEHALGRGQSLILVECTRGPYNQSYLLLRKKAQGNLSALSIKDWDPGQKRFVRTSLITNPEFLSGKSEIYGFRKGRGVADCGDRGLWRWRSGRLVLMRFWRKTVCDGAPFEGDQWQIFPRASR
ncbi:MAG: DUF1176 domain-containing protein [Pseudolabrys sp.]|nr:DUF1176 domain-containing protein [Pseudolabrys sp.]